MYQGKYVSTAPKTGENKHADRHPKKRPTHPRQRDVKKSTVLFYSIYGGVSLLLLIAILCLMIPLRSWLVRFEASQPHQQSAEIFQQLFSDPDWASIYTMAGEADTPYENKESFAVYMNSKLGDTELSYLETSAGLSGDHKYVVKAGEESIATFTLTNTSDDDVAQWKLGTVALMLKRSEDVTVTKLPGQTVFINGVALNDSHTIRTISTLAESHLPEGTHGYRLEQQYVDGFLMPPAVTVKDAAGNDVEVVFDLESGIYYTHSVSSEQITSAQKALAENAAKTYAAFMIRAVSKGDLGKVFDTKSDIYRSIVDADSYVQGYSKYTIEDLVVSDFYSYSDALFSVRVALNLNVTRTNGTVKEFAADNTYFFTKNTAGNWLVTNMVNVNIQQQVEKVRLTFMHNGNTLASTLVDASPDKLNMPAVTAPEGKVFAGWAKQTLSANGSTTMTVMFTPDESGAVYLDTDTKLEPMTLYALFKDAGGEQ